MSDTPLALFVGISGLELTADEGAFLRDANPYGLFLFRRNLDNPEQVRRLCAEFREVVGRPHAPVFIDQEGGRVQRLDNGKWPSFRSLGSFGALARKDQGLARRAVRLSTQAMGTIMSDLTIDSGTTPVVDLARKGTHDVIGQRAFGDDPELVVIMAREVIEGMLEVGALPIMKHIPGYGRVTVDPHFDCPIVDATLDDLQGGGGGKVKVVFEKGDTLEVVLTRNRNGQFESVGASTSRGSVPKVKGKSGNKDMTWRINSSCEGGHEVSYVIPSWGGHIGYSIAINPTMLRGPLKCSERHSRLVSLMDEGVPSEVISHVGECGLLELRCFMIPHLDDALISAFVERWQPDTNTFHLPFGEVGMGGASGADQHLRRRRQRGAARDRRAGRSRHGPAGTLMDFSLTDEQEALHGLSGQIFADRAKPDRVEEVEGTDERFDRQLWSDLAQAGLLGVAVPTEHGGLGLGMVELALVCEQQGRSVAPVPLAWTTTAALAIAAHGSTAQQQRWLPGVVAGDLVLTSALPQCALDVRLHDGVLSGALAGVPAAHVAAAVLVPVDGGLYAVDLAATGVTVGPGSGIDRQVHCEVRLDAAPAESVGGPDAADWLWQRTVVALAAVQSGVTAGALRMAADYTSSREQFGKPLSTFQGVALKAADGYIDNAAIRATMLHAAWRLDRGDDATAEVLTAAWWAAEAGQRCVHVTQHLHGGIGADITYPVHRYFLWGKQIELMVGGASATLARLGDVLDALDAPGDELSLP